MYAKYILGRLNEQWGNASRIPATATSPYIGGLVLTYEGPGHVAVIIDIVGDTLILAEGNYQRCRITIGRTLRADSPLIRGYR